MSRFLLSCRGVVAPWLFVLTHSVDFCAGIVTIPASVYQSVTTMQGVQTADGGTIQVAMAPPNFIKQEVPDATQAVEVTSIDPQQVVVP